MYTVRIKFYGWPKWKYLERTKLPSGGYIYFISATPKTFFRTKLEAKKALNNYKRSFYKIMVDQLNIVRISFRTVYKDKV